MVSLAPICFGIPMTATVACGFVGGFALGVGMAACLPLYTRLLLRQCGSGRWCSGCARRLGGFFLPQLSALVKSQTGSVYLSVSPLVAAIAIAMLMQQFVVRAIVKSGKQTATSQDLDRLSSALSDAGKGTAAAPLPQTANKDSGASKHE